MWLVIIAIKGGQTSPIGELFEWNTRNLHTFMIWWSSEKLKACCASYLGLDLSICIEFFKICLLMKRYSNRLWFACHSISEINLFYLYKEGRGRKAWGSLPEATTGSRRQPRIRGGGPSPLASQAGGPAATKNWIALQRKSHLCIPFLGIARPQPQFPHSCVCERFI